MRHHTLTSSMISLSLLAGSALAAGPDPASIKRGAQLAAFGGCVDCHTPIKAGQNGPEKDMARGLSGHPAALVLPPPPKLDDAWNWGGSGSMTAFVGPWGISYASNLTPDRETGIGAWSQTDFIQAMRKGKHLGVGRAIMPPMPWQAIGSLPDRDLRAIFAYLKSQPPVKNAVPEYVPPVATRR